MDFPSSSGGARPQLCAYPCHVIRCETHRQPLSAAFLANRGYRIFNPTYAPSLRSQNRKAAEHALFPGYLFGWFDWASERRDVLQAPGVMGILETQSGAAVIEDQEIERIRLIQQAEVPVSVNLVLSVGMKVVVIVGPLIGREGIVSRMKKERVDLDIDSSKVQILRDMVRPLK